jgi:glycosyltransferase involved in cell wall biosynthesis
MRISFFTHYADLYGANRSLLDLILGLRNAGVEPYVIYPCLGDLTNRLNHLGVPSKAIPFRNWVHSKRQSYRKFDPAPSILEKASCIKKVIRNAQYLPNIIGQLRRWNIDLVYTNSSVISVGFIASKIIGKPHIWHLREFGDLDYNLSFDWGEKISYRLIESSNAIVSVSYSIEDHFLGKSSSASKNCYAVYNGIAFKTEIEKRQSQEHLAPLGNKKFIFALVGLLHPCKGQRDAIKALSIVCRQWRNIRFTFSWQRIVAK